MTPIYDEQTQLAIEGLEALLYGYTEALIAKLKDLNTPQRQITRAVFSDLGVKAIQSRLTHAHEIAAPIGYTHDYP